MDISKCWWFYALLSCFFHSVVVSVNQGFWVELDSPAFVALAQTKSLSYCTPIGYSAFLFVFGAGAKFLWIPVVVQFVFRSCIIGLIIAFLSKKYHFSLKKSIFLWIIFHADPQQIYYNISLMAESLLTSVFLAQWYVWQQYKHTKKSLFLWLLYILTGTGLYLKPVAIISVVMIFGYALLKLKYRYQLLTGTVLMYLVFYISVSSLYYWRYSVFEPDIFKGILFWNNASVLTPELKKDRFQTDDAQVNHVLQTMYQRADKEYAFQQDDNRIFEDSSFTQQYIHAQILQGKTYRQAIVHTNRVFGRVAKYIVLSYPISFIREYILPNTKEWFLALGMPHRITYLVPTHLGQIHTHAKTYSSNDATEAIHSTVKPVLFIFAIAGTFVGIRKKQRYILQRVAPVWIFVFVYVGLNILLHPLEYRYIYPVIAGMQLISVFLLSDYLNSAKNKDKVL